MGRYTNPDDVKVVINFAECAEVYGFPRAVRRYAGGGGCDSGYHRLPVATPFGNVDRPMMLLPESMPIPVDVGPRLIDRIIEAALADPWGLGLTMGICNPLFD
jgi:hypothetical protein